MSLEEIAKIVLPPNHDNSIYSPEYSIHEKVVETFRDMRIVGLQGITDFIFSEGGNIKCPNTVDITEFFLLNETFKVGLEEYQNSLGPALKFRVKGGRFERHSFANFLESYAKILNGEEDVNFNNTLAVLESSHSTNSLRLLKGNYMNPDDNTPRFDEKRVLVTGSDTGIGRETALEFVRRGASVVFHYPNEKFLRGAKSAVELSSEYGGTAGLIPCDFRSEDARGLVEESVRYLEGLDILVNVSGITLNKPLKDTTPEEFDSVMDVNVRGAYFATQAAVKYMRSGGNVINMGSLHTEHGMAGHSVYSATKGAISSLTNQLAVELGPSGIKVNAVNPGWTSVRNQFELLYDTDFNEESESIPSGRINRPIDIANSICTLCTDQYINVNGIVLPVDGGMGGKMFDGCMIPSDTSWGKKYM